MRTRRKLVLVTVALLVASLVVYLQFIHWIWSQGVAVPAITGLEIRNPEIALRYGIVGYVEITVAPDAPRSLTINKGGEASITILLHFVSHVPEVTETQVEIDPNSSEGLMIEQVYVIEDEEGNIIGRGVVNVNKLVSYDPSGVVTIKAGQTLPVTLTIRIPTDFPRGVDPFPLGAVGITAANVDVAILDDLRVKVYA